MPNAAYHGVMFNIDMWFNKKVFATFVVLAVVLAVTYSIQFGVEAAQIRANEPVREKAEKLLPKSKWQECFKSLEHEIGALKGGMLEEQEKALSLSARYTSIGVGLAVIVLYLASVLLTRLQERL